MIKNKEEIEKYLIKNHVDDHNWTNGLYYAMEEYAQSKIKLLNIPVVVGRSEQFICPICESTKVYEDRKNVCCGDCNYIHRPRA